MARWEEVLDIQLDVHNYLTGPDGRLFGEGYFGSAYADPKVIDGEREGNPAWTSEADARERGARWAHSLGVHAFNAEPIWVDPDMMTVVENAVAQFKPEPLLETDLITPNGFLVLPRSMWLTDPSGNRLSWKMAVWFPIKGGIHLSLIHDTHDRDDVDLDPAEMKGRGLRFVTRYLPTHVLNWPFGQLHPGSQTRTLDENGVVDSAYIERDITAHQQVQGTWRLLTQYLAVHGKLRVPRAYAKRAARAKMPTEHVTIVRLRRPPQPDKADHEPTTVEWTHRWIVGGHWRWQWYATPKDPNTTCGHCGVMGGTHRQIWIHPFQKGPADMPLIVNKARVFEFVR